MHLCLLSLSYSLEVLFDCVYACALICLFVLHVLGFLFVFLLLGLYAHTRSSKIMCAFQQFTCLNISAHWITKNTGFINRLPHFSNLITKASFARIEHSSPQVQLSIAYQMTQIAVIAFLHIKEVPYWGQVVHQLVGNLT